MNFEPVFGWYYISSYNRSPSWTGVEFFYDFLVNNTGPGPYAVETDKTGVLPGDIIQLASVYGSRFDHSLIISGIIPSKEPIILISSHTNDAYMRPLSTYRYRDIRYLHIEGTKTE